MASKKKPHIRHGVSLTEAEVKILKRYANDEHRSVAAILRLAAIGFIAQIIAAGGTKP